MIDSVVQNTSPVAATTVANAPAVPAPAVESAPVSQVSHETVSQAPSETVLGVQETVADVSQAEKPATDKPVETKPAEIKPVEAKAPEVKEPAPVSAEKPLPEGEKKEEASQSDEPASLPSYEPWKFPEGMEVDQSQLGEVNKMFGEFEQMTKADHALVQEFGQKIIDRHVESVQAVIKQLTDAYQKSWEDQTKSWYESYQKDPEIGGDKMEKSSAAAREFIRRHGGNSDQQNELRDILKKTGIGNHPAFIRTFANATANLSEGKVVPAGTPPAAPTTRKSRFYGAKKS